MALFGSACLIMLLTNKVPELALEGSALSFGRRMAALAALVTAPVWFTLVATTMADRGIKTTVASERLWQAAGDTLFGQIFFLRMILLLALVIAVWLGRTRLSALLSGAALVALSLTSHTAAASPGGFRLVGAANDGLHFLAGGYWFGGLCVLLAMLAERPSAPRLAPAVSVFAEWGMIAVLLLVMTGMINAAMVLLGSPGHDTRTYVIVLCMKLVLVAAMVGLALVNHFRLLPRLNEADNVAQLRRHAGWELALGIAVVGLAAVLAVLPPTFQ